MSTIDKLIGLTMAEQGGRIDFQFEVNHAAADAAPRTRAYHPCVAADLPAENRLTGIIHPAQQPGNYRA